ncbi:uncharacterized protein [Argopecten irradians]|uniref:uncharacterized protein n=1 Tax=Argopecten irradians TaxID=31199 RepID=UPI00372497B2
MAKFQAPEKFDFSRPSGWQDWSTRFARYRTATKLHKDEDAVQISALIYAMGSQAEHVFKTLVFDVAGDEDKYDKVIEKFHNYFIPKRNIIHERARFHQRSQAPGESVEEFVRALYEIAEHCNFSDQDEFVRDRVVIGLSDRNISEKLQMKADLTLETAIQTARQAELVKSQIRDQGGHKHVEEVKKGRPSKKKNNPSTHQQAQGHQYNKHSHNDRGTCSRCARTHGQNKCPAIGRRCRACNKMDHFACCCRTKKDVKEVTERDEFFLGAITSCYSHEKAWEVTLKVGNTPTTFKIDNWSRHQRNISSDIL